MKPTANWPLVWALWATLGAFLEGIALGEPQLGDTMSEVVRNVVYDPLGRFVMLPLWAWLTYHWMLKPPGESLFDWRDVVALAMGLGFAVLRAVWFK